MGANCSTNAEEPVATGSKPEKKEPSLLDTLGDAADKLEKTVDNATDTATNAVEKAADVATDSVANAKEKAEYAKEKVEDEAHKKKEEAKEKAHDLHDKAEHKVHETKEKVEEAKHDAESKAKDAKHKAEKKGEVVKHEVENKAHETKEKAEKVKENAEHKAHEVKDKVEKKAEEVKDEAHKKEKEVEHKVNETKEAAHEAKEKVEKKVEEKADKASKKAHQVEEKAKETVDEASKPAKKEKDPSKKGKKDKEATPDTESAKEGEKTTTKPKKSSTTTSPRSTGAGGSANSTPRKKEDNNKATAQDKKDHQHSEMPVEGKESFDNQAGGHAGAFVKDEDRIMKQTNPREVKFYETHYNKFEHLHDFVPHFYGVKVVDEKDWIILQDLTAPFHRPCVLDIKMGNTSAGDGATEEKVASMRAKDEASTTIALGYRFTGFRVWQQETQSLVVKDKVFTKKLKEKDMNETFSLFFGNGKVIRKKVIKAFLDLLLKFKTYFEGDETDEDDTPHVQLKMIDFANVFVLPEGKKDDGYLMGLNNVIKIMQELSK